jgi:hypothetical protein
MGRLWVTYGSLMGHLWVTYGSLTWYSWDAYMVVMRCLHGDHGRHHHTADSHTCWHRIMLAWTYYVVANGLHTGSSKEVV